MKSRESIRSIILDFLTPRAFSRGEPIATRKGPHLFDGPDKSPKTFARFAAKEDFAPWTPRGHARGVASSDFLTRRK